MVKNQQSGRALVDVMRGIDNALESGRAGADAGPAKLFMAGLDLHVQRRRSRSHWGSDCLLAAWFGRRPHGGSAARFAGIIERRGCSKTRFTKRTKCAVRLAGLVE